MYSTWYESPVGPLLLAGDGERLSGLWTKGQKYFGGGEEDFTPRDGLPAFRAVAEWLDSYFAGERPSADGLPLSPRGGAFRQRVWRHLLAIPYGELSTYGTLARAVAAEEGRGSMSAQAVGGAVGHNPIAILIPCHRVVGAQGSLTGYAGGVDKKLWLLRHEGVETDRLTVPRRGTAL